LALKRYTACIEFEGWSAHIGFALMIEVKTGQAERLSSSFDRSLSERYLSPHQKMIVSELYLSCSFFALSHELRNLRSHLASRDGLSIQDIALFPYRSHKTVQRIEELSGRASSSKHSAITTQEGQCWLKPALGVLRVLFYLLFSVLCSLFCFWPALSLCGWADRA